MLENVLQTFTLLYLSYKPWLLREHVEQHSWHMGLVGSAQSEDKITSLGLFWTCSLQYARGIFQLRDC